MKKVKLILEEDGKGLFYIEKDQLKIARLEIIKKGDQLWAVHTEVDPEFEGQGLAGKLFSEMVDYARENKLTVIARCSYVLAKFKKQPDQFADIWKADT